MWRYADHPDVVIKFEDAPYTMTFLRGSNYNMNLVTEKNQWVGTQSVEAGGWDVIFDIPLFHKERVIGCTEHMSDKHCRYAHVRVIENTDARVVVHWRYALCDVLYQITDIDLVTGWGNCVDEYYTVYPDGVAIRSFLVHGLEWSRCSVTAPSSLNPPGKKPEDDTDLDAMSVANMAGESRTYSFRRGARNKILRDANILRLNLKAQYKPFYIYEPGAKIRPAPSHSKYPCFHTFNHWPVAQVPSWGRVPVAPDRLTSSEITALDIPRERREGDQAIVGRYILGLTDKAVEGLLSLAKSWIHPPALVVNSDGFSNEGYSRDERAYILRKQGTGNVPLELVLHADKNSQ